MTIAARAVALLLLYGSGAGVLADTYSDGWGPAVGKRFPEFVAKNHLNVDVTLDKVMGARGALLFFNRSAVW